MKVSHAEVRYLQLSLNQRIIDGTPFTQALAQELQTVGAQRVYLLASGTLSRHTDAVHQVLQMLGSRSVGG